MKTAGIDGASDVLASGLNLKLVSSILSRDFRLLDAWWVIVGVGVIEAGFGAFALLASNLGLDPPLRIELMVQAGLPCAAPAEFHVVFPPVFC